VAALRTMGYAKAAQLHLQEISNANIHHRECKSHCLGPAPTSGTECIGLVHERRRRHSGFGSVSGDTVVNRDRALTSSIRQQTSRLRDALLTGR